MKAEDRESRRPPESRVPALTADTADGEARSLPGERKFPVNGGSGHQQQVTMKMNAKQGPQVHKAETEDNGTIYPLSLEVPMPQSPKRTEQPSTTGRDTSLRPHGQPSAAGPPPTAREAGSPRARRPILGGTPARGHTQTRGSPESGHTRRSSTLHQQQKDIGDVPKYLETDQPF